MKRHLIQIICVCGLLLIASPGAAEDVNHSIAVLVNGQVISNYDVTQRTRLLLVSLSLEPTPENIARARKQVIKNLVDETLQRQEAERLNIQINPQEFSNALHLLANRNNMTPEKLVNTFIEKGVRPLTLRDQILNDIIWQKVVDLLFRESLRITREEIENDYALALKKALKDRYLVSEIYMGFLDTEEAAQVQLLLEEIIDKARSGKSFSTLAYQFSEIPSAIKGGAIGWVTLEEVAPALRPVLQKMTPGDVSDPIPTPQGFYVLLLREYEKGGLRDPNADTLTLGLFTIPKEKASSATKAIKEEFADCSEGEEFTQKYGVLYQEIGPLQLREVPAEMRGGIERRKVGEIFSLVESPQGERLLAICDYRPTAGREISRALTEKVLGTKKLQALAQRYLQSLRRDASIEYR